MWVTVRVQWRWKENIFQDSTDHNNGNWKKLDQNTPCSVTTASSISFNVYVCVCGCVCVWSCTSACALVCMRYLCFLGFYKLWSVQWLGHLLPPVSDLLQDFMCVCPQVSGFVVSNWSLCEFCGHVYCDIWYIFSIPQFFRHQKMDKFQKHNSFHNL
jgi:hypothetical protein